MVKLNNMQVVRVTDLFCFISAILNPKQPKENKSFNFDFSYWSHTTVSIHEIIIFTDQIRKLMTISKTSTGDWKYWYDFSDNFIEKY